MLFLRDSTALVAAFLSLTSFSEAVNFTSRGNVAVYWGQNSYGQASGDLAQQPLATYCANASTDIINLSLLYKMTTGPGGQPVLNFANQQNGCSVFPGTALINCPNIGADIKTCQSSYNKTILLTIGGNVYNEGGFANSSQAQSWANQIWFMFGPKTSSSALRPFGDAVVDGFDLDFEMPMKNIQPFANRLRLWLNSSNLKKFYLTAAPQCPYPDVADDSFLNGGVAFDAVFVQYYNNYCGSQSYNASASTQNNFNFATWDNWAKTGSANKNVKVFLGVPGGPTGAGSGYLPLSQLQSVIAYSKTFSSFGGVSIWDASQVYANPGFLRGVKIRVQ